MKRSLKTLLDAAKNWNRDNVVQYAAAVSFYTLFSIAPITIIAVTVAGVFFGRETATRELEKQMASLVGPASAEMVRSAAQATESTQTSTWSTIAGVGLMLFGATTVFGQLQASFNRIWHVQTKPSRSGWFRLVVQRLLSLTMVVTLGFLLLVSLVVSTAIATLAEHYGNAVFASPHVIKAVDLTVGLGIVTLLFGLLFRVLPDVHLRWRDIWLGAVLTAVLFTIGRFLIALYLGHSTVASIYGTAGSLVALLIWVYYSCAILFFGVEFIRAYRESQGLATEPKETAVLVREEFASVEVEPESPPPER